MLEDLQVAADSDIGLLADAIQKLQLRTVLADPSRVDRLESQVSALASHISELALRVGALEKRLEPEKRILVTSLGPREVEI